MQLTEQQKNALIGYVTSLQALLKDAGATVLISGEHIDLAHGDGNSSLSPGGLVIQLMTLQPPGEPGEEELEDNWIIDFGSHQDERLGDVDADWLLWLYDEYRGKGSFKDKMPLIRYIEKNWKAIQSDSKRYASKFTPGK